MKQFYSLVLITIGCLSFNTLQAAGTFEEKIYPIIQNSCASVYCHGGNFSGSAQEVYDAFVNVDPQNQKVKQRGHKLVYPGYPDRSFLFRKCNNEMYKHQGAQLLASEGKTMPPNATPLAEKEIEYIRQWILYGAPFDGTIPNETLIEDYFYEGGFDRMEPPAPPEEGKGFQIYAGPFFMEPEGEREFVKKEDVRLPADEEIIGIEIFLTEDIHHFAINKYNDGIAENIEEGIRIVDNFTDAAEFLYQSSFIASSQHTYRSFTLPEKTAFVWEEGTMINFNLRLLNYSANSILPGEIYVNIYTQPKGTAEKAMQSKRLIYEQSNPSKLQLDGNGRDTTLIMDFFDKDSEEMLDIWSLASHTHKLGIDYDIYTRDEWGGKSEQIFEGFNLYYDDGNEVNIGYYDFIHPPYKYYTPQLSIPFSQGITIEATYNNPGPEKVGFGLSTEDEMLIAYILYTTSTPFVTAVETPAKTACQISVTPNPIHTSTTITYEIPEAAEVELRLYDYTGKKVKTLHQSQQVAGKYHIPFSRDKIQLPAGLYLLHLKVDGEVFTDKLIFD